MKNAYTVQAKGEPQKRQTRTKRGEQRCKWHELLVQQGRFAFLRSHFIRAYVMCLWLESAGSFSVSFSAHFGVCTTFECMTSALSHLPIHTCTGEFFILRFQLFSLANPVRWHSVVACQIQVTLALCVCACTLHRLLFSYEKCIQFCPFLASTTFHRISLSRILCKHPKRWLSAQLSWRRRQVCSSI